MREEMSMGRTRRLHIPDAYVHVTQKCHNSSMLLMKDEDKLLYLSILAQVAEKMRYDIVSFCLQDNHFHFILKTPPIIENHTLSQFMHAVNNIFSHQYNLCHKRSGTVWNSRFHDSGWLTPKQVAILLILIWYVEGNTVRRKRSVPAREWRWCSAYYLFNGLKAPVRTSLAKHLTKIFGKEIREAAREFEQLLSDPRPNWRRMARSRRMLPVDDSKMAALKNNFRSIIEQLRQKNFRSWRLEVEHYSMLLQPQLSLLI
jgi:REP element-mobilizing transposase RayT